MGFRDFFVGASVRVCDRNWVARLIAIVALSLFVVGAAQAFLGAFVPFIARLGTLAAERATATFFVREGGKLVASPLAKSLNLHGSVVALLGLSAFNWPSSDENGPPMHIDICHTSPDGSCSDDLGSGGGSASGGPDDFMGSVVMLSEAPNAMFANTDPDKFDNTPSAQDPLQPAAKEQVEKPGSIGETAPSSIVTLYNELLDAGGSKRYDIAAGGVADFVAVGPLPEYKPQNQNIPCSGPAANVPPAQGYTKVNCYGSTDQAYSIWRSQTIQLQCPPGYESFGTTSCVLVEEYETKKSEGRYPCQVAFDGERFRKDTKNPECDNANVQVSADGQTVSVNNGASGASHSSMQVTNNADGTQTIRAEDGDEWTEYELSAYDSSQRGRVITGSTSSNSNSGGGNTGGGGGGDSGDGGNGGGSGGGNGGGDGDGEGDGTGEPELEDVPTANEIIDPFFESFWPELSNMNFAVSGECPIISFDAFDRHFEASYHCDYLNDNAQMIAQIMLACFSIMSLGIVMRA